MKQITTSKIVEEENKTTKDRREGKSRVVAFSRRVFRIQYSDIFYVESAATSDNIYYFVKYHPSVFELYSCKDNSTRHKKYKHFFAIEFAIKWRILKDIDKLPATADIKLDTTNDITTKTVVAEPKSYRDDDYTF